MKLCEQKKEKDLDVNRVILVDFSIPLIMLDIHVHF